MPAKAWASASSCSTTPASARTTLAFAAATACGGNDAIRAARRSTNVASSSVGRTRLTQPHRSAVSASMSSHPRMTSNARLRPINRGRRTVPVPPGMMPRATSGWLNIAVGPAKRMSQLSAISLPPPPTRPSITAIVAFGIWRSCSHILWYVLSSVGGGAWSVGNSRIAATSKWAMNHSGLAERRTTTRTASSRAMRSMVSASSR